MSWDAKYQRVLVCSGLHDFSNCSQAWILVKAVLQKSGQTTELNWGIGSQYDVKVTHYGEVSLRTVSTALSHKEQCNLSHRTYMLCCPSWVTLPHCSSFASQQIWTSTSIYCGKSWELPLLFCWKTAKMHTSRKFLKSFLLTRSCFPKCLLPPTARKPFLFLPLFLLFLHFDYLQAGYG